MRAAAAFLPTTPQGSPTPKWTAPSCPLRCAFLGVKSADFAVSLMHLFGIMSCSCLALCADAFALHPLTPITASTIPDGMVNGAPVMTAVQSAGRGHLCARLQQAVHNGGQCVQVWRPQQRGEPPADDAAAGAQPEASPPPPPAVCGFHCHSNLGLQLCPSRGLQHPASTASLTIASVSPSINKLMALALLALDLISQTLQVSVVCCQACLPADESVRIMSES